MEQTSSLGLYLTRRRAVAVWLSDKEQGAITRVLDIVPAEGESAQTTALEAARQIRRQPEAVEQAFAGLDCGYYAQYSLNSEFSDPRQIESTVKFDAEEAAATDAMNLAVAFTMTGPLPTGSEVMAFTADRQLVTDLLLDLQEGGLDPVMIEPDAVCLSRVLEQTLRISEHPDTLYLLAGQDNCYLIQPGKAGYAPRVRTFLLADAKQRTVVLPREILLAIAGQDEQTPLKRAVFVHPPEGVDRVALAERTGLEVRIESVLDKLRPQTPLDSTVPVDALLIAVGAGMAPWDKMPPADFRRDFMPYQGKRKAMEASLRLVCISLSVLFAAMGLYFQSRIWRTNGYTAQLKEKLAQEYHGAMYGASLPTAEAVNSRLRRTLANVKRVQEGLGPGDEKSVPAKLTFLLEAINNSPPSVDVVIQQIVITERSMRVKGDTNNRKATLDMFEAIKKHPRLKFGSERMAMVGNRDTFEFTVEPAQQ